ncbi:MAG TPA: hypothetical protein IAA08_09935 [Candidatus Eubacterium avistercoris]|uniref:Uncharacterized protein n=1 Tax=Candidatus Eubacterium avistercoris TaxID=2838567 RepID=A0A9D2D421_9FIRM|nr:hypothetical protein [Candidatus Eubacterium avistercoris]
MFKKGKSDNSGKNPEHLTSQGKFAVFFCYWREFYEMYSMRDGENKQFDQRKIKIFDENVQKNVNSDDCYICATHPYNERQENCEKCG